MTHTLLTRGEVYERQSNMSAEECKAQGFTMVEIGGEVQLTRHGKCEIIYRSGVYLKENYFSPVEVYKTMLGDYQA